MIGWNIVQDRLQGLGRALMLPIAVLPVAGLMLRLGQPDLLSVPFIAAAGQAIFGFLGLLFAIGVAVGLAKENNGAAGLAGAVAYVVLTEGAKVLMPVPTDAFGAQSLDPATRDALVGVWKDKELAKLSVPAGIVCGLAAGSLYNRYHQIRFPEYLSFFGGRRFIPIISGLFGLIAAAVFGFGFSALEAGVDSLSSWVAQAGSFGLFLYGLLNRILIITGLHHILNNVVWFVLGDFQGATGDLNRFFAGDPDAGAFMSGFFPVMMFGLPAACLAMWRAAPPDQRGAVSGLFISMALTSFLTGVTEPIEFTFMFLAPLLYALHAILTGISMVVMDWLGSKIGFGFSAGLFDYVLNYRLSTKPLLLVPVGLAYAAAYYFSFSYAIRRFDLATPGRRSPDPSAAFLSVRTRADGLADAEAYLEALGGMANLSEVSACTTRLRLLVVDKTRVSESQLRSLGAKGIIQVGGSGLQVVIGPDADRIAVEIRQAIGDARASDAQVPVQTTTAELSSIGATMLGNLGGKDNVEELLIVADRLLVKVRDRAKVKPQLFSPTKSEWVFESRNGLFHVMSGN